MSSHDYVQLVALPPGYVAEFEEKVLPDGTQIIMNVPAVALALDRGGDVAYLVHDDEGNPYDPRDQSNFLSVRHPGQPRREVITVREQTEVQQRPPT